MQPQLKSGEVKKMRRHRPARARQIKKRQHIRMASMIWQGDATEAARDVYDKVTIARYELWISHLKGTKS